MFATASQTCLRLVVMLMAWAASVAMEPAYAQNAVASLDTSPLSSQLLGQSAALARELGNFGESCVCAVMRARG